VDGDTGDELDAEFVPADDEDGEDEPAGVARGHPSALLAILTVSHAETQPPVPSNSQDQHAEGSYAA
jgi:hypothetical protein